MTLDDLRTIAREFSDEYLSGSITREQLAARMAGLDAPLASLGLTLDDLASGGQ